jgi:hypothetical protein
MQQVTLTNTIVDSTLYGVYINLPQNNVTLQNNTVTSCERRCLRLYAQYCPASIDGNVFQGLGTHSYSTEELVWLASYLSQGDHLSLQDNSFGNWETSYNALYVEIRQSAEGFIGVSNNRFYNISARHIFNLNFQHAASHTNVANTFESNLEASDSAYSSIFHIQNWPESCGDKPCSLVGNIFNHTLSAGQYHLAVTTSTNDVATIDASLCYWGTEDESSVIDTMYDGRDDVDYIVLDFLPYLLTPDPAGNRR